jgi:hypothetical protein
MSDENENAIRNVYIQTIQDLAKERDELKEKLAVAMGENKKLKAQFSMVKFLFSEKVCGMEMK